MSIGPILRHIIASPPDDQRPQHSRPVQKTGNASGNQGVAFLAALSIACPVAEMSCPAPPNVWQALRNGTATVTANVASTTMNFLFMTKPPFSRPFYDAWAFLGLVWTALRGSPAPLGLLHNQTVSSPH